MASECDYSTVAQECSGITDRNLHPDTSPAGKSQVPVSTKLLLTLIQPNGIMLMNSATGECQMYTCLLRLKQ